MKDRAAAKAKREAEEARQKALQDQAEREKKGKGQQRARSPEPYRQKKQYPEPPPWRGAPQIGKGGKAPKPPKSPPPTKEVITINEQSFTLVARPSKNKQAPSRKLPPNSLEGKGQEAASSSSVTVPVHDLQGKAKAEISATYGDFALRTVLQNMVRVFDPKQTNRRVRDTSPMDQIAELVLTHDLDWTTVEGMLECAVHEENAASTGRSDQSLSSRGRPEKRRTRRSKSSRERRSSSSGDPGTASKYQERSRSRRVRDPTSSDTERSQVDFGADDDDETKGNTDTWWTCNNCKERRLRRDVDQKCHV